MNAVAPTMLSSSNVPQPEFACWWPSSPSACSSAAYSARFSPFMMRCCQSMLTCTFVIPRARSVWMTCSVMPTLPMWIFIAGSEFLCSSRRTWSCSASVVAASPMPSMRRAQLVAYGVWKG